MMKKPLIALFLVFLLAACQSQEAVTPPQFFPLAETAQVVASPLLPTPTQTILATAESTQTLSSEPSSGAIQTGQEAVLFISETVPDGTKLEPGAHFIKTWKIKNNGTLTWTADYALVLVSSSPVGETLGGAEMFLLPSSIQPGQEVEIGVELVAPTQDGRYTVTWQLCNKSGEKIFGSELWASIQVGDALTADTVPVGGVSAQLVGASLQGAKAAVDFCMQMPDSRAWDPWDVSLLVSGQQFSPAGSRIDPATATTPHKCFSFSYLTSAAANSGSSYQLSIGNVGLPPEVHQDENCAYAKQVLMMAYPGLDFVCGGPGFWYTNLVTPSGMTVEQADKLILDTMSNTIYGPWLLNGTFP